MDWLVDFPSLEKADLRSLKKAIDNSFREFIRAYGEVIEQVFEPLKQLLIFSEQLLLNTPWPIVLVVIGLIAWLTSRSIKIVIWVGITLMLIGIFGMWENTMRTLSMVFISTMITVIIGMPLGIAMSRSDRLQRILTPVLDIMQTMPSFVYLIPVVMLLGIGKVPGLLAIVIYALPPIVRFTNLGIRLVPQDLLEAADSFGTPARIRMLQVQLPLALPTIMGGINQTVMMALAMIVIASMIGVQGLGQPVLKAITNQYFTLGLFNGLAIVGLAVIIDRITQAYGKRLQKHLEIQHG